jgi:hypothetical protein
VVVRQSINQCQFHRNGAVAANAQCSPGWRIAATGAIGAAGERKGRCMERKRICGRGWGCLCWRREVKWKRGFSKKSWGLHGKGLVSHLAAGGEADASGTLGRGSPSLLLYEAGGLGLEDSTESVVAGWEGDATTGFEAVDRSSSIVPVLCR